MAEKRQKQDLETYYREHINHLSRKAPFVLRITEWKEFTGPVLVVKQRYEHTSEAEDPEPQGALITSVGMAGSRLVERGHLTGEAQRRCLPLLRKIVSRVTDSRGIPLELHRFLTQDALRLHVTLPLDEEAGAKLGLIFRLQERIVELDRVELICRRVALFTREEAAYWLSRTTSFGPDANRWAISGLRLMLGGQPNDPGVGRMLQRMRDAG